jgi:hypothetical protein
MPTENRSSTIEQHDHIEGIIDMVSVPREVIEFAAGLKWHGYKSGTDQKDDQFQALNKLRTILAAPAPQSHAEPIAWTVGTAIWWTKEEAERDAAATGLPIVGLGPMTATGPAEQKHREPVAWVRFRNGEPDYDCDAVMISNVRGDTLGDGDSWEPVYTRADPGEVERLRSIERSYGLREALLEQVKGERDRMIARTMELSGQLADQDALLQKLKETLQREYWDEYAGLDETRELIEAAMSASQEPSTPAAPYPNRLCHIDYTAHPHRCGCLKGDEESQRIYDEHCRTDLARQP